MARRKRRGREFEDDDLDDLMPEEDDDDPPRPRRSFWYWIFVAPGSLILWLSYIYASPERYWVSARARKSRFFQVFNSIFFWIVLLGVLLYFLGRDPPSLSR